MCRNRARVLRARVRLGSLVVATFTHSAEADGSLQSARRQIVAYRVGNSDSPSDHDLASLQWARAIAAMAVVVYHCGQVIEIRTGLMVTHITDFGAAGVDVFFVVSGLIMTLTTRRSNPFLVGDFLVRRAIRLVPIYWFYTLLKSVALLAVPGAALFSHFSVTHLLSSLFFIPFAVDGRGIFPVILVGWTLNCEVLFYLLFAASKALLPSRAMLLLSLVLVALAASHFIVGTGSAMLTFWTNPILLEFALGVGAAELYLVEVRLSAPASALLVLLGTGALVAIPEMPIWRPLLWSVPAVALVFGMLSAERFVPSRRVRAMVSIDNRFLLPLSHPHSCHCGPRCFGAPPCRGRTQLEPPGRCCR